jgi:3-oxoacyl-[acyl-carrier protein] reductase
MYTDLNGKVAVVTGGSKALGAGVAGALAEHGVHVAVNGRDEQALAAVVDGIRAGGGQAIAVPADLTDTDAVAALRDTVEHQLGPVDIVAAFAGGNGRPTPSAELGAERWRATLESDLTSTYLTVSAFLPSMMQRRTGSIVMMSSTAGRQPSPANVAYAVAKAGVVMLTKHLAAEVAGHGIRVNCLAPSSIVNEKMQSVMSADQLAGLARSFPLGRLGEPADIAAATLFLASDAASWITGVTLDVTGGRVIV